MSDQSTQEPTMEEILASIRRIISEDDAPAAGGAAEPEAEAPAAPAVAAAPPPPPPEVTSAEVSFAPQAEEDEDEVLELTEKIETHGDLDVYTPPVAAAPPPPARLPTPDLSLDMDSLSEGLVGATAANAAASAFGQLTSTILMPRDGRTLEDVVRELLRPLLKDWLDEHLPGIVEASVQTEVERIARGRIR